MIKLFTGGNICTERTSLKFFRTQEDYLEQYSVDRTFMTSLSGAKRDSSKNAN